MDSIQPKRGSIAGVVLGVVALVAVVAGGWWLFQGRAQLQKQVGMLQSDLSEAQARLEELQGDVDKERSARAQAEQSVSDAETATAQARQELQDQQQELGKRIQELEAGTRKFEQQVAAAEEARAKAEAELSREAGLRQKAEQAVADAREELQQAEALVSRLEPSETTREPAGADAGAGGRTIPTSAGEEAPGSRSTAAKQNLAADTPDDTGPAFDTPPRPIDLARPEYPRALQRQGTEGNVQVAFTVDTRGRVQDVEVQEATHEGFETAAVAAVRKWRFKPALRNGEPVAVRISQRLQFNNNN